MCSCFLPWLVLVSDAAVVFVLATDPFTTLCRIASCGWQQCISGRWHTAMVEGTTARLKYSVVLQYREDSRNQTWKLRDSTVESARRHTTHERWFGEPLHKIDGAMTRKLGHAWPENTTRWSVVLEPTCASWSWVNLVSPLDFETADEYKISDALSNPSDPIDMVSG